MPELEVIAILISVASLVASLWTWRKTTEIGQYDTLDRFYFDLIKLRLDDSEVTDTNSPKYDPYAFMIWNFIETVYDHSYWGWGYVWQTWKPVAVEEAATHWEWFNRPEHRASFKQGFQKFVDAELAPNRSTLPRLGVT